MASIWPYPPPQQWQNTPSIPNQYNGPCPITGKVVRVRPNIYIFVCNFCFTEYRTIDNFLRHSESHFELNAMNSGILSPMAAQPHSNQNAIGPIAQGMATSTNAIPYQNSISPYPVQLTSQIQSRIDVTSSASSAADDMVEEVYEIIDLGYDDDGKYPDAKNIDASSMDQSIKRGRQKGINRSFECWFCNLRFTRHSSMVRHENTAHQKLFRSIISQKKVYKCKLCNAKFPKESHTLQKAQEHLKFHSKSDNC